MQVSNIRTSNGNKGLGCLLENIKDGDLGVGTNVTLLRVRHVYGD